MKKNVSLTLDVDVIEGVKALAEESDRSFSQYVNVVLKHYLKSKTQRNQDDKDLQDLAIRDE